MSFRLCYIVQSMLIISLSSTSTMNIFSILFTLLLALFGHNISHENAFQRFPLHASLDNRLPSMSNISWAKEPDNDQWAMPDMSEIHTFYMITFPVSSQITSTMGPSVPSNHFVSIKSFCTSLMAALTPLSVVCAFW